MKELEKYIESLPEPLNRDGFTEIRKGIYDSEDVSVLQNSQSDFAFLFPVPDVDYSSYEPRSKKLGLVDSKKASRGKLERLRKIANHLKCCKSFLEIGCADGSFLECVREQLGPEELCGVEPDAASEELRNRYPWLEQFGSLDEVPETRKFDHIGLYHVFEHIQEPAPFLEKIRGRLAPGGSVSIEVPNLHDPLLSLFHSKEYADFYFQAQHPFYYSGPSLNRVFQALNWVVAAVLPYQRYGLDNHLNWIQEGRPGGNETYRNAFGALEAPYRDLLEEKGQTDTVIAILKVP